MSAVYEAHPREYAYAESTRSETLQEARNLETEASAYVSTAGAHHRAELENAACVYEESVRRFLQGG